MSDAAALQASLPARLLIGPLSPELHTSAQVITNPLNSLHVLGAYANHPQIQTFFVAAEGLAGSLASDQVIQQIVPEQRLELALQPDYVLQPLLDKLSPEFQPDVLIWWGLQHGVPADLPELDLPKILIVSDWHFHYLPLEKILAQFDYLLCDQKLLTHLHSQGFNNCAYWPAYGFDPAMFPLMPQKPELPESYSRPIDVAFAGNLNPHKYRQRNQYLARLARLPHQIVIRSDLPHPAYLRLLQASKIVFNHALRQEMNLRAYEAAACGALLLVEADNLEVAAFLKPGEACVSYTDQNLEAQIAYYLAHPVERQQIAARGQAVISKHTYQAQFGRLLHQLPQILGFIASKVQAPTQAKSRDLDVSMAFPVSSPLPVVSDLDWQLSRIALALSTDVPCLRIDTLSQAEALLQQCQSVADRLTVWNALLVTLCDLVLAPPRQISPAQRQALLQRLGDNQRQFLDLIVATETPWQRNWAYNLAWIHFFQQEGSACRRYLTRWQQLPAQQLSTLEAAFLLPVRYSGLYLLYQTALFEEQTPAPGALCMSALLQAGVHFLWAQVEDPQAPAQALQHSQAGLELEIPFAEAYFEHSRRCFAQQQVIPGLHALRSGLHQGVYFPGAWRLLLQRVSGILSVSDIQGLIRQANTLFQDQQYAGFRAQLMIDLPQDKKGFGS